MKKFIFSTYLMTNRIVGPIMERLISLVVKHENTTPVVPIFIIGAPRSGTTLTFQLLVHSFRLGYLTNMHCLFFGSPALVSIFMQRRKRSMAFVSSYGRTTGHYGPSECGEWWYRFFPRVPVYASRENVDNRSLAAFRRSLASFAAVEKRPVVFKNLYAGMRLDPILSVFPNAVFIHVRRNMIANALSILEGRRSANGGYDTWWSLPPPGFQSLLDCSPAQQVVSQISMIDQCIENDVGRLGVGNQVMEANYEDICQSPANFLVSFKAFMMAKGFDLAIVDAPPERFQPKESHNVPEEIRAEVVTITEEAVQNVR